MTLVYVSSDVHPSVLEKLATFATVALGYGPEAVSYDSVKSQVDAVLLRAGSFTAPMMDGSPRLRIVARHGAGVDSVDIAAATQRGIWVSNTPGANGRAVAEHVFALLLALQRHLPMAISETRSGRWSEAKTRLTGHELLGKTLGLLGYGSIGRETATIARGLGMNVIVSDPALTSIGEDARRVTFDDLLAEADVLSLHLPLLPQTRNIIDAAAIAKMKPGAVIINTSRGGTVDETALVDALRSGHLGGAAIDVLDAENIDNINPLPHNRMPYADLPNLIVTPHIGGQTVEAMLRVGEQTVENIRAALDGGRPAGAVNII